MNNLFKSQKSRWRKMIKIKIGLSKFSLLLGLITEFPKFAKEVPIFKSVKKVLTNLHKWTICDFPKYLLYFFFNFRVTQNGEQSEFKVFIKMKEYFKTTNRLPILSSIISVILKTCQKTCILKSKLQMFV